MLKDDSIEDVICRQRIGFVFNGVGDHYSGMGDGLLTANRTYAKAFAQLGGDAPPQNAQGVEAVAGRPAVDLRMMLTERPADAGSDLGDIHLQVLRVQLALTAALAAAGVQPDVVFGISLGQVSAAVTAGILSVDRATDFVRRRAELVASGTPGEMLTVMCAADDLPSLPPDVHVAIRTSPRTCTIAGTSAAIASYQDRLDRGNVAHQTVHDSAPFHSPLLGGLRTDVEKLLVNGLKVARIPIVSDATGRLDDGNMQSPQYWSGQMTRTIDVASSLTTIAQSCDLLLEVGPGQLRTIALMTPELHGKPIVATMRRRYEPKSDLEVFEECVRRCRRASSAQPNTSGVSI